jgi:hypothetical protein
MDDPRHARLRGVVSRAFTPRVLARIAEDVRDVARGIVAKHSRDFLGDVGPLLLGDEMERVREMVPGLVDVDRYCVRGGLRHAVVMETRAAALLAGDPVPHLIVQESVEVLRCENSLTFLPRMAEGTFHDSWRGRRAVVELRLRFDCELVEVRPEVVLQ